MYLLQKLSEYYRNPLNLKKDDRITGVFGWLFIALFVLAYDIYAMKYQKIETLTRFFWRSTEKNILKSLIPIGAWLVLSFHLLIEKPVRKTLVKG